MDRVMVYDMIYALTARDGREKILFGNSAAAGHEAFARSITGEVFPEMWFELPLLGEPWFDVHVPAEYYDVAGKQVSYPGQGGVYAKALEWFAAQPEHTVRQLFLSYDSSTGDLDHPAVQLLLNGPGTSVPHAFLEAVDRADLCDAYSTFVGRLPSSWYACYVGVFPARVGREGSPWLRIECLVVSEERKRVYAEDAEALRKDLERTGLSCVNDELLEYIQAFARTSFDLEFQFNVDEQGRALPILGVSMRFVASTWTDGSNMLELACLMAQVQEWGLADDRWHALAQTIFAKRVSYKDESIKIYCFPAFVKFRWREGELLDAKSYLLIGADEQTLSGD